MRGEREAPIEDDCIAFATNRGYLCRKMQYIGRRSCPDHFIFGKGELLIAEFKRQGKHTADPLQAREHKRYAAAGWQVHIINDRDQFARLLGYEGYVRD